MVEAQPSNMENIMSIRTVDLRLTFRSSSQKGYFKNKINRMVKSFTNERSKLYKGSKTTYGMWFDKNNFKYATRIIPLKWLKEKRNVSTRKR